MIYEVRWTEIALQNLGKLDKKLSARIFEKVEQLANNPFSFVKKLKGLPYYSLRIGDYRVILSIDGKSLLIWVVKVGHRKNIYERL